MPRYFDNDLPRVGADKLKPMVKIWGGRYKMSKYDCIDFIVAALKDPARVQAAVTRLEPWERNALALIKRMGGIIQNSALKIGILASGLHPRRTYGCHTALYRLTRESVYRGLEGGTTISDLLDRLQHGSQIELPQNVIVELREWASLRERFTLRRGAHILEFSSASQESDSH